MSQGKYTVFVRAKDGTLTNMVTDYASLDILMTLNDPGSWSISSTTKDKCPFDPGNGVCIVRDGTYLYGGIVEQIQDTYDVTTGLHHWQVTGVSDLGYLNRRICYVEPATGRTTVYGHYTDTGYLSIVIERLIAKNLGPSAMSSRQEPIIKAGTSGSFGPSVSVSLRFQKLLSAVVAYVTASGYNIRPVWDESSKKIWFELFQGRDLSSSVVFTEQLSNILASEFIGNVPDGNYILAGGAGELTARDFADAENAASISDWGRIERFQDGRNQTDLDGYADQVLAERIADSEGYSVEASDDDNAPQFGKDYLLGDYVSMKVRGEYLTAQVQQVEVSVSDGIESVSPKFGVTAVGKFREIFKKLSDLRQDVNELLGTEVA